MMNHKKKVAKTKALLNEEDVQENPDQHIDQDFPGFPHLPADKKSITGKRSAEKKPATTIKIGSKK